MHKLAKSHYRIYKEQELSKIIATLTLSAFLGISGVFANGVNSIVNSVDFMSAKSNATLNAESKIAQNLSKHDIEFLFGSHNAENLNMRLLSKQELEDTKGMWIPTMLAYEAGAGFIAGVGWYFIDISPEAEIDLGDAFISGLKGAGTSIVFGHLGFARFIK